MKKILLLFVSAAVAIGGTETYKNKFEQLCASGPKESIRALASEWLQNEPNNPEAYILPANHYFSTHGVRISSTAGEPIGDGRYEVEDRQGQFVITDPTTGQQVGSIGPDNRRDARDVAKAKDLLRRATMKFPRRMDIWCGLAYMMEETGDFDAQFGVLKQMIETANKTPNDLLWLEGKPVQQTAEAFVPEKLHGYATYYCRKETDQDDERFFRIAELAARSYPNHPYAFNDLGLYYSIKKNLPETRRNLELAVKCDSTDTLVLMNLADTCLKMNDKGKAREYCRRVISLNSNLEQTRDAKKMLAELDPQIKS